MHELENELGCFFDRNPDGTVHQKAFAGQTFDRTVHKGDLTGIEIINRLAEQVWARGVARLEEHRAVELVLDRATATRIAGVLMIDMRSGEFVFVQAQARCCSPPAAARPCTATTRRPATRAATGSRWRCARGCTLRDMEMVQFHPTGLLAGAGHAHDRHRARGRLARRGRLPAERRERALHGRTTTRAASAPRATWSRARMYAEMRAGRGTPNGGALHRHGPSRARQRAPPVQGHGGALRRLRLRPRRRPGRGGADRALHDGRRRVLRRLPHRGRGPVRRGRGHGRRARRQPPRRQRRRQLDRVRRASPATAWRSSTTGPREFREPAPGALEAARRARAIRSAAAPATSRRCASRSSP